MALTVTPAATTNYLIQPQIMENINLSCSKLYQIQPQSKTSNFDCFAVMKLFYLLEYMTEKQNFNMRLQQRAIILYEFQGT